MEIETTRMSSKGQVVIPQDIREEAHFGEGTLFAVISSKDTIMLKRIKTPSKQKLITELEAIAKQGKKHLEKKGIKESDIPGIVEKSRRRKP